MKSCILFQIAHIPDALAMCPRLKVLRFEENCVSLAGLSTKILSDSNISLLASQGNLFNAKEFQDVDGYETVIAVLLCI